MRVIIFELVAVFALIGFAVIVWWPSALLVVAVAAGFAAWNLSRSVKR